MTDALRARLKFYLLMGLFFLPILVSMWSRHLDVQIEASRYLAAPMSATWSEDPVAPDQPPAQELADLSE